MVSLNDIVSIPASSRYAVVIGFIEHGRRKLAKLHYIDPKTGDKMECPDHRCNGQNDACPIHGRNVDTCELEPWRETDINYYAATGMLTAELARKALAPEIEISRVNTYKYRVRLAKHGENIRIATVTSENNNDLWQDAIALTNDTDRMTTKLTDPDNGDYQNFLALFQPATV
jgi:hypothetical protein